MKDKVKDRIKAKLMFDLPLTEQEEAYYILFYSAFDKEVGN